MPSLPADAAARRRFACAVLAMTILVAASNILVQFQINDWLTWGALTYPVTFLVTDLINRSDGTRIARRVVLTGFLAAVAVNGLIAFQADSAILARIAGASVTAPADAAAASSSRAPTRASSPGSTTAFRGWSGSCASTESPATCAWRAVSSSPTAPTPEAKRSVGGMAAPFSG